MEPEQATLPSDNDRPKGQSESLTVRRMSKNDTWKNMKLQSSKSLDLPAATDEEQQSEPVTTQQQQQSQKLSSLRRLTAGSTRRQPSSSSKQQLHYIINDEQSILEATTAPDRINALLACDTQVLSYNPRRWTIVLQPRGRNVSMIAIPLLVVTLWGIMWILILSLDSMAEARESIADLNTLISPLLVPVSFLLVFRLGRAAVRFWDARKAMGKIVETCRVLISTAAAAGCKKTEGDGDDMDMDMDLLNDFARWTCVFPIAVKNFLRPATRKGWDVSALKTKSRFELGQLVSDEEAMEILNTSDDNLATIFVLNKLRLLASQIGDHGQRDFLYQQLNMHIDVLIKYEDADASLDTPTVETKS